MFRVYAYRGLNASEVSNIAKAATITGFVKQNGIKPFVSPNPSNGLFNVLYGDLKDVKIKVTDVLGNEISTAPKVDEMKKSIIIDLSKAKTGVYVLKTCIKNQSFTTKIIRN